MKLYLLTSMAVAAIAQAAVTLPAQAQEQAHDHQHDAAAPEAAAPVAQTMNQDAQQMDHGQMDHPSMDHGSMHHGQMKHDAMIGNMPAPKAPNDWAADAIHGQSAMAAARAALFKSTSDTISHMVLAEQLEYRASDAGDAVAWMGRAWYGGDIDRILIRSEGEAKINGPVEAAEIQALWSHAIAPYANLEIGVRYDIRPQPNRSYASIGIDAMLPYWIETESAFFLSDKGDVLARAEFSHDMRLTNHLILQPRVEFILSAQDIPEQGIGSGLSDAEFGLRLRYAHTPAFAPYVGVNWERKFGDTGRYARAEGESRSSTNFVAGVRFLF